MARGRQTHVRKAALLVGVPQAAAAGSAGGQRLRLGAHADRRVHSAEARREGSPAGAAGRQAGADPPRLLRSHRAAALARGGAQFRRGPLARRVRESSIDRLLASPHYGERWGRHWLDVVRYADSDGLRNRPLLQERLALSRLRDPVLQRRQAVQPVRAGADRRRRDLAGRQRAARASTSSPSRKRPIWSAASAPACTRSGRWIRRSALDGAQLRYEWLTDVADTTGAAFLGLSLGCARCHDHKFDPISQKDYYRLQAIFAGSEAREIPAVDAVKVVTYWKSINKQLDVEQLKAEMKRIDEPGAEAHREAQGSDRRVHAGRAGRARQTAAAAGRRIRRRCRSPTRPPPCWRTREIVPDVHMAVRGDFRNPGEKVGPGFPAVLCANGSAEPAERPFVPQRRKALALWLTRPDHPLTARVMVNRIWQWHFGRGIVAHAERFRTAGRAAHASRAARLAGDGVRRARLEHQGDAPPDHAVEHLPHVGRSTTQRMPRSTRRIAICGA